MPPRKAPPIQRILARLTGKPRMVEPSHEHIIRVELRALLERDCYEQVLFRLENSPDHLEQLVHLLNVHEVELPGIATISQLAKRGIDISGAIGALSIRLLCDDLNISAYSSRALTHHYLSRMNFDEVDALFTSGVKSAQYGCAEALREACLAQNLLAMNFLAEHLSSDSAGVQEYSAWALRSAAEFGIKEVNVPLMEIISNHMDDIKQSANARLDVYRILCQIQAAARAKEE
jgi:hypothetical protein